MSYPYITEITWNHDMTNDSGFQAYTSAKIASMVETGETNSLIANGTVISDGQYTYSRLWNSTSSAQEWIDFVSSYTGYISSQIVNTP